MKGLFEELKNIDFDYINVYERFLGDEELFTFCFNEFINEESFDKIKELLNKKKYSDAVFPVHALKGVSANLGLNRIYELLCDLTEDLRADRFANVDKLYNEIEDERKKLRKYASTK